jgi:hypothetical protein
MSDRIKISKADRKAEIADLTEFGDAELTGAPSIAKLISVYPEGEREAYRKERREALARICQACGIEPCTWREYFEGKTKKFEE